MKIILLFKIPKKISLGALLASFDLLCNMPQTYTSPWAAKYKAENGTGLARSE